MKKTRLLIMILTAAMIFAFPLSGCSKQNESEEPADAAAETETEAEAETETEEGSVIDYMVLVNQSNQLPDGWEEALETTTITNSVGDEVYVESKAYEAYCKLKEAVEKDLEGYDKGITLEEYLGK